ncbi:uncharacterized mitochondrial protein-like protein [Tanacetum coccineum]
MPKALISDRGTHFCNKIMEKTMKRYGVNHRFSTSYHPQTSGQVENTNRALKRIIEKTVKDNPAIWSRKLDDTLWAFRTAYKTPTGTTPYKLVYGKNCHLPFEIEHRAYWALKNCNLDLIAAGNIAQIMENYEVCSRIALAQLYISMPGKLITGRRRDQDVKTCHFPDSPRLKFVRIGEDYQEYGLSIPKTMRTEAIKQFESYQMFIKYSTGQIPPKKSGGKGSQRKKTADDSQETVDVSEESEPEPEPVKRKTSSKRRVKKKVTLSADDNIIFDDPDTALELGKSISKTEAEEAEAARQVHATHARIVTEYGVPSLTPEQEVADIMQALKESKKTSKRHPGTRGSSEGTSTIPGVPDESTVISATSSEGTGTKPGVPAEEKDITEENVILEWGSEQESEYSEEDKLDDEEKDDKEGDADDEDDETESEENDIYKYKIRVHKDEDEDEEMINVEVDDSNKGFGDQFLKLSSDSSLVSTVKDTTNAKINSLLEVKIQSEVPHTQSLSMLSVLVFVISEPSVFTPVQEYPSKAIVTTLPHPSVSTTPSVPQQTTTPNPTPTITTNAPIITTSISKSNALSAIQLRVAKLEKDVSDLKKIDHSIKALAALKTQVPSVLPKKQTPTVDLEQGSEKSASEILKIKREQAEKK